MTEQELNRVRDILNKIRDETRKLNARRREADSLVPILDGTPHTPSQNSRVEGLAIKIVDSEHLIDRLKDEMAAAAIELSAKLQHSELNPHEYEVISARYVACKNFRAIQFELHYSDAHVFYLHRQGVKKLLSKVV